MPFDRDSLKLLLSAGTDAHERVGFIIDDDHVVEVVNVCSDPVNGFEVSGEDLVRYCDIATATWHTHPGQSSNLTVEDHSSFLRYPKLKHHIVGVDGISTYYVEKGKVLVET